MKPRFAREIALLSLPVLLFGGAALWNGKSKGHIKLKSWSGWGAPLGLYDGKPRLEIAKWQKVEPSALDFGRGISSRWKVTTWHGGACPTGGPPPISGGMVAPSDLYFEWKRAGKWTKTPFQAENSELEFQFLQQRQRPTKCEIRLGLPLDLVPSDAEEVRLKGHLQGLLSCGNRSVAAPSALLNQLLKAPGEAWPQFSDSRVTLLKMQSAKQKRLVSNLAIHPINDDLEVNAIVSYPRRSRDGTALQLHIARSWLTNAKGKSVMAVTSSGDAVFEAGLATVRWRLKTTVLKARKGSFTLKSWVYVNQSGWPLKVSIPLKISK